MHAEHLSQFGAGSFSDVCKYYLSLCIYCCCEILCLQEIQRQKALKKEQTKLEDIRVMEYLKEKEVRYTKTM